MSGCEYCGRSLYLSEGDTCKGCGAPLMDHNALPAVMYDRTILTDEQVYLFRPGENIPIRLPEGKKIGNVIRL